MVAPRKWRNHAWQRGSTRSGASDTASGMCSSKISATRCGAHDCRATHCQSAAICPRRSSGNAAATVSGRVSASSSAETSFRRISVRVGTSRRSIAYKRMTTTNAARRCSRGSCSVAARARASSRSRASSGAPSGVRRLASSSAASMWSSRGLRLPALRGPGGRVSPSSASRARSSAASRS
ncbi:hypothetical protein [Nannocystis pusilla]|uniref:hypothetical protein n=1 Tax=Nannocystis pusilla TaxID=889268 RepID=UPI003B768AA5